jgi:NADH dehydrogenase (ubiquinone) flavoprotein 2
MKTATLHHEHQPADFEFTADNLKKIEQIFALYPEGRQQSAIMPMLDMAQRQVAQTGPFGAHEVGGGWIPRAAMDEIARLVDVPPIKVYEVATFYSMYNLHPVGKYLVQICTTSPCMLGGCGSDKIVEACKHFLKVDFEETTEDGLFTMKDVECLGACVNAPMVQINDDYYEDLTPESIVSILSELKAGRTPKKGPQNGRQGSCPCTGPTTLKEMAKA